MSVQASYFFARAAEAKADAASATLDNVRERCLRSEAAWTAMAVRADRSDKARVKLAEEKAALALA